MATNSEVLAGALKLVKGGSKLDRFRKPGDDVEALIRRYRELDKEVINFELAWQQAANYVTPRKNNIIVRRVPGQLRNVRAYDSNAMDARDKLASLMHGTLTPAYMQWAGMETDFPELNATAPIAQWLDDAADRVRNYLNRSNLDQEAHEIYTDLPTFHNGLLFTEEAPRDRRGRFTGLLHRSVNIGRFVWAEGADGRVNAVFRTIPMSVDAIRAKWLQPKYAQDRTPDETKKLIDSLEKEKPDRKLNIVHAVYPADEQVGAASKSVYILLQQRVALERGFFEEFPFAAVRWAKTSDEAYGRGPTDDAMPDILALNKIVQLELEGKALSVRPAIGTRVGGPVGTVRLFPGAQVAVNGTKDDIWKIDLEGNFESTNVAKKELVESIRRIYYYDQATLPQGPQMTAEEVASRMELMYRLLGPTAGRIENEFMRPLFDRVWGILWRAHTANPAEKILPELPPELVAAMRAGPVRLRVVFKGPLARAQQSQDAVAVKGLFQQIQVMQPIVPSIVDVVDFDEGIRVMARATGVAAKVVRDAKTVANIRAQAQAAQQQQEQQAQVAQAAEAAGKAAPALKLMQKSAEPGSLDAMMTGSQNGGAPNAANQAA